MTDAREAREFQEWMWGHYDPQQFAIDHAPITYATIALLAGVSEDTVRHWMQNPDSASFRAPSAKAKQQLALAAWWLMAFNYTPEKLVKQFDKERKQ